MKSHQAVIGLLGILAALIVTATTVQSQEKNTTQATVQVHVVVTDEAVRGDSQVPTLQEGDVKVKQGKSFLKVDQLTPARGEDAALQLFILIDDTLDTGVGNNLNDLKDFISAQPASTLIGIGYMANATVQVAQDFTADHSLAVNAVRLPRGNLSTMDSPYLSLISLVKGWPQEKVRREVLVVTDGIDRLRGTQRVQLGPSYSRTYHSLPVMSPDVNSASEVSQRHNVLVYSMYAVSVGRTGGNLRNAQIGLSGLNKLADETGGRCFSLGTSSLVSFKPYLERLQKNFDNQYYVDFEVIPGKKEGFQRINVTTEVPNAEIAAPDNVWVPAAK